MVGKTSKPIQFTLGPIPAEFSYHSERYLYNEPRYLDLKQQPYLTFYILQKDRQEILGQIHFHLKGQEAISIIQAPFGGIEVNRKLPSHVIDDYISIFETALRSKGIKSITIKQFPFAYSPVAASKITNCFLRAGYNLSHPDLNHHILVDDDPIETKFHYSEKRKIKRAVTKGILFKEESFQDLNLIYDFILSCRKQKGQELNISLEELNQSIINLPERYKIFTVLDNNKLIATSIVVLVNDRIAYNFLPASDISYNNLSPMVFLIANLYQYCHKQGIEILDLGISSVDNVLQNSLIQFKERLGGLAGLKPTFKKEL